MLATLSTLRYRPAVEAMLSIEILRMSGEDDAHLQLDDAHLQLVDAHLQLDDATDAVSDQDGDDDGYALHKRLVRTLTPDVIREA